MRYFNSEKKIEDKQVFDKQLVLPLIVAGIVFAVIAVFINIELDFGFVLKIIPYAAIAIFLALYFMGKSGKGIPYVKWILVFITLVFLNFLWYYNFGTHGPTLYLFVLVFSYLVFMLDGKQLLMAALIIVFNVAFLFYTEFNHPAIVGHYPTDHARIVDVYVGIFLYLFLMYVMMSGVKKIYLTEYQKATESDRLKSSFLANMSHEIRTPLNAIVGFSNLLAQDDLNREERMDYVDIINSSNQSLLRLVNDILDVSLIETNQLQIIESECNLKQMMLELEKTYQRKLSELNEKELEVKLCRSLTQEAIITTDCERLRQVMVNLLDNAIKYTEKGTVCFAYEIHEAAIRFYVRDTGIGVDKKHLPHLFDYFYKVEDKNEKLYRGTGIGLFLCKSIVELLGGKIDVNSELGKGSEFYFYLYPKTIQLTSTQPDKPGQVEPHDISGKLKVLIVEDQLTNRQYLDAVLKSEQFELLHAVNGREGLERFRENPDIQLILMDIKMPEMDGFEALKEIRKLNTKVPVYALTAHAMSSDKEACMKAGFDAYFAKPIDKKMLMEKIRDLQKSME